MIYRWGSERTNKENLCLERGSGTQEKHQISQVEDLVKDIPNIMHKVEEPLSYNSEPESFNLSAIGGKVQHLFSTLVEHGRELCWQHRGQQWVCMVSSRGRGGRSEQEEEGGEEAGVT